MIKSGKFGILNSLIGKEFDDAKAKDYTIASLGVERLLSGSQWVSTGRRIPGYGYCPVTRQLYRECN